MIRASDSTYFSLASRAGTPAAFARSGCAGVKGAALVTSPTLEDSLSIGFDSTILTSTAARLCRSVVHNSVDSTCDGRQHPSVYPQVARQKNVQLRIADEPEGPWLDPIAPATSGEHPGLYATMTHPWSGTGELTDDDGSADLKNLYLERVSVGHCNVVLMQTDVSPPKTVEV